MSELPTRNLTEILNAIEARVNVAKAKGEPCHVVLVREWEYLLAIYEHPHLARRHWKRDPANLWFKGVPVIPACMDCVDANAPPGAWLGIARKKPD